MRFSRREDIRSRRLRSKTLDNGNLEKERSAANQDVPLFIGHGINDDIVPLKRGTDARDALAKLGYKPEFHQYPMPHSVHPDEIADIGAWFQRTLL